MEWVETTAKSVEEAKDRALDQLGVAEDDAEFEVLEEPKPGLFGRIRGEARVRARVAPREQRPKQERRPRRRRSGAKKDDSGGGRQGESSASSGGRQDQSNGSGDRSSDRGTTQSRRTPAGGDQPRRPRQERQMDDEIVPVERQAEIIREFLTGLLAAFDLPCEITDDRVDDETITLNVNGENLGLLIGPKGQTLASVQDLSRTYLQRKATGTYQGRVRIDVSGYRQRRQVALGQFAERVAGEVKDSGAKKALEPMGAADRKVVHDTVNEIDGVRTLSEGEEPRRRVVLVPEG